MSTVNEEVFRKATAQDDKGLEDEAKLLLVGSGELAYKAFLLMLP
jgi:hypothetical protein